MPRRGPAHSLAEFIAACADPSRVRVLSTAMETAPSHLNLHSERRVIEWIANGGICYPEHANTDPWKQNPKLDVDSYNFYSGKTHCYIAFIYSPTSGLWLVKSLKRNNKQGPRAFALGEKLKAFMAQRPEAPEDPDE